jgi:hypothetical protein
LASVEVEIFTKIACTTVKEKISARQFLGYAMQIVSREAMTQKELTMKRWFSSGGNALTPDLKVAKLLLALVCR